jgi:hypothetical protein
MRRWRSSSRASVKFSSNRGGRITSPAPRRCATSVVSPVILLLNVQFQVIVTGVTTRRGRRIRRRDTTGRRAAVPTCREWDSNESSTDSSSDEDATNIAINKGLLFTNVGHKCFMAKDGKKKNKVHPRATPKYTTSSYEGSSSEDEDDLLTLFANLNMQQIEKLNELIGAIHEKDDLLESQEDFLIKENKKAC